MRNRIICLLLLSLSVLFSEAKNLSFTKGYEDNGEYKVSKTISDGDNYTDVTYTFEGAFIQDIENENRIFQTLRMNDATILQEKGNPELPVYTDFITVGTKDANVEIINIEYADFEDFNIIPSKGKLTVFQADTAKYLTFSDTYKQDALYPSNNINLTNIRSYRSKLFAVVELYPILYNPGSKKIRCCKSITYRVSFKRDETQSVVPPPQRKPGYKSSNADYLIVTTSEFLPAVTKFKNWKTMQGYKCDVISPNVWKDSSYVKKAIDSVYNINPDIEYLLIVGDQEDVPGYRYKVPDDINNYYGLYATDLQYTWMPDKDTSDFTADVTRGRISVDSLSEAYTVLDKIIHYEMNPVENDDFYNRALHCSYFQTEDHIKENQNFITISESIRNQMLGWGKDVTRVYYTESDNNPQFFINDDPLPSELQGYSDRWKGNATDIHNHIQEGCFYVFHSDHGGYDGWGDPHFTNGDADKLNNGDLLPFFFSNNCLSGGFQCPKESFTEHLMRNKNGGAVGAIASTSISYTNPSNKLVAAMFELLFPTTEIIHQSSSSLIYYIAHSNYNFEMGKVFDYGLLMTNDYYTNKIYHYFGDPSMQLYTQTPTCLNPTITEQGNTVTVNTNGVQGCRIALTSAEDNGEKYMCVVENKDKYVFENIDFPYNIVITKNNYKPYISNVEYIQNITFTEDKTIEADHIYVGNSVDALSPKGDVIVRSGNVTLNGQVKILLTDGFKTNGGNFIASLSPKYCPFSYEEPDVQYDDNSQTNGDNRDKENGSDNGTTLTKDNQQQDLVYADHESIIFKLSTPSKVEITDMLGRVVYSEFNATENNVPLSQGIYIVKYGQSIKKVSITH